MTIGFLGAGQLGEPMVGRLVGAGHEVIVFARRDEVRGRLRDLGATVVNSIAELAAESDILIGCLFSDAQLRETGRGPGGFIENAKQGAVFISHTTGSIDTLTSLCAASDHAPLILDAPVSGSAEDIRAGALTVLIGGDEQAVSRVRPVLGSYADPIVATGELGSALRVKLINNILFAANAQLTASAVSVGERLGVRPDALLRALSVCSGSSQALKHIEQLGGPDGFGHAAAPFLRKDVAVAVAGAEQIGADLGLLVTVAENGPLALT